MESTDILERLQTKIERRRSKEKKFVENEMQAFVRSKFRMRDCSYFKPKDDKADDSNKICHCGRLEEEHDASVRIEKKDEEWSTDDLVFRPTNGFGTIYFSLDEAADNKSEFLRISTSDSEDDLMELLTAEKFWNALSPRRPKLCLYLLTSQYSSRIPEHRKEKLINEMVDALQSCDSWFINNGLNITFNNLIGRALSQVTTNYFGDAVDFTPPKTIGICPWGCIEGREELCNDMKPGYINYSSTDGNKKGTTYALLPYNSHLICLDDGTVRNYESFADCYMDVMIATFISSSCVGRRLCIPLVFVLVGGDANTLLQASKKLVHGLPLLICKGSGFAADLVVHALELLIQQNDNYFSGFSDKNLKNLRIAAASRLGRSVDIDRVLELLRGVLYYRSIISIYDLDGTDVLTTKVMNLVIENAGDTLGKLYLSLSWCNSELANDFAFKSQEYINPKQLEDLMLTALLDDELDFVKLFLKLELDLKQFLTVDVLHSLYNVSYKRHTFTTILRSTQKLLQLRRPIVPDSTKAIIDKTVHYPLNDDGSRALATSFAAFLGHLMDKRVQEYVSLLRDEAEERIKHVDSSTVYLSDVARLLGDEFQLDIYNFDTPVNFSRTEMSKVNFRQPADHLCIWAITHGRQEMALFFLRISTHPVNMAVFGASLYRQICTCFPSYDTKNIEMFAGFADEFEQFAVDIIEVCENESSEMTSAMLNNYKPLWSATLASVTATNSDSLRFTSTNAFQKLVWDTWENGLKFSIGRLILVLICPLILLSRKFPVKVPLKSKIDRIKNRVPRTFLKFTSTSSEILPEINLDRFCNKLRIFYGSPRVKFVFTLTALLTFLVIFSVMLLFDLHANYISYLEMVVMVYSCAWIIDDLNTFVEESTTSFRKIVQLIKTFPWIIPHLIADGLFVVAACLRIRKETDFIAARYTYSLLLLFSSMKLLDMMMLSWYYGPIVVMITKMLRQLINPMITLFIIMIGYGAAVQVLLYPKLDEASWNLVIGIFYYPYFQLFGEMSFEFYRAEEPCDETQQACPEAHFEVILLHAAYMLIAVLIFLNLLIAIFSKIFSDLLEQSKDIWMQNRFRVVFYFSRLNGLPPPFSMIQVIITLIIKFISLCCKNTKKTDAEDFGYEMVSMHDDEKSALGTWEYYKIRALRREYGLTAYLHSFQQFCGEKFYKSFEFATDKSFTTRFNDLTEKITKLDSEHRLILKHFTEKAEKEKKDAAKKKKVVSDRAEEEFDNQLRELKKYIQESSKKASHYLAEVNKFEL